MKKTLSLIIAFVTVAGLISLSWIFERYPPGLTSDLASPDFNQACESSVSQQPLDSNGELTVSVWNIYKQQNVGWKTELTRLLDSSELVLLQEASLTTPLKSFFAERPGHATMVRAFTGFEIANGVLDVAAVPATDICAQLTTEPLIRLPKSTLVASYPLSNGESLLVVNLHSVNFSWGLETYTAQLKGAAKALAAHQGPVIVAGDFNTWREGRIQLVNKMMAEFGLKEVKYQLDERSQVFGFPLDHIFYRGLHLESAQAWQTQASDHNPIQARFSLM
ncbi:endonuclease/exonuclease/phosphatase family protein [Shewanella submarina]|uniref:Endonuclease/exonuclease/phosphatase family protein n=1 Tax=Shewanella submarina TaxID=2016376 RepID=A0ABV7GJ42_9GAMM|nr:endonuclease/exonuclease/phosphatase family protein [Shewanella submarina]MCL1038132.1 endonuclease/exonuclease/phosphatase family protein [Shewanella submarina]